MLKKLLLSISVLGCFSTTLSAQSFGDKQLVTTQSDKVSTFTFVDIDVDGDVDIIAGSNTDDAIFWYRNLGDNTFATKALLDSGSDSVKNINIYDIDEDGKDDIVYITGTDIYWIKNLGSGFFLSKQSLRSSTPYSRMQLGDIDGDGKKDIIYAQLSSDFISWDKNNGGGSFTSQSGFIFNPSYNIYNYSFGEDFDENGVKELTISASQHVLKFEYVGGTFQQTDLYYSTTTPPYMYSSKFTDLDGDNKVDVFTESSGCSYVWMKNFGSDVFSTPVEIGCGGVSDWRNLITVDDFNEDGNKDILQYRNNDIYLRTNTGSVTFATETDISGNEINGNINNAAAFDIDNDGDLDVFYASATSTYTTEFGWFENTSAVLSVADIAADKMTLQLYPNPANSILNISSSEMLKMFEVYNITGQVVLNITTTEAYKHELNISDLAKGVYFLKATTVDNASETLKFIKN